MRHRRTTGNMLVVAGLTSLVLPLAPGVASAQPTCYTKTFYDGTVISSCPRGAKPNRIPGVTLPPRAEPGTFGPNQPNPSAMDAIVETYQVGECAVFIYKVARSVGTMGKIPFPHVDPLTCAF